MNNFTERINMPYYRAILKTGGEIIIKVKETLDLNKVLMEKTPIPVEKVIQVFIGQTEKGIIKMNQIIDGVADGFMRSENIDIMMVLTEEREQELENGGKKPPQIFTPQNPFGKR
jgi:hypothetical protein